MIHVEVPMALPSRANKRGHTAKLSAQWKRQRELSLLYMSVLPGGEGHRCRPTLPAVVLLTRIAPRELDDDNLAASLKSPRDGVADWLGVDDRDPRVRWQYAQRKADKPRYQAVAITVVPCEEPREGHWWWLTEAGELVEVPL